jgi:(p)ppGpp synthase/HD superfamily hydrolase
MNVQKLFDLQRAVQFAYNAHAGQLRKYTGRPYIEHPMRVATAAAQAEMPPRMIIAAWLHDTVEDCAGVTLEAIHGTFGQHVAELVGWLTNPSKQHPALPRGERKAMDRHHIAGAPFTAQWLKLADRTDNLQEMAQAPADFRTLYAAESILLAKAIRKANPDLEEQAERLVALAVESWPSPSK